MGAAVGKGGGHGAAMDDILELVVCTGGDSKTLGLGVRITGVSDPRGGGCE